MHKSYKEAIKNPSYYQTRAQQLSPNQYFPSSSVYLSTHSPQVIHSQPYFTFNKNFYSNHNISALPQNSYTSKYRSASLPSQCLVRTPSKDHFSYIDQLKRRDYIVGKNYRSTNDLKKNVFEGRKRSYDSLNARGPEINSQRVHGYNNASMYTEKYAELNRFSKFTENSKKLSKSTLAQKGPLIKTNIKLYEKPDRNNRMAQITSNFQPIESYYYVNHHPSIARYEQQCPRPNQNPIMDCNIEMKSDDDGRYFSTVQSQFPTVINKLKTFHNEQDQILTTQAVLLTEYPNHFDKISPSNYHTLNIDSNHVQSKPNQDIVFSDNKDRQTEYQSKNIQKYDTYIVRNKQTPVKVQENYLSKKPQYNQYLESMDEKQSLENQEKLSESTRPNKRKANLEYQINSSKKQKSPKKSNTKRKNVTKTHADTMGLKYYYSKYYLAEQENQKRNNKSRSSSIRNQEKSQTKQRTKRSSSKQNTQLKSTKKISLVNDLKTKEKIIRPCQTNYAQTHLFTAKK